ncbi:MAG: radical SAM protein [Acidobacteriota bacterium]
MEEQVLASGVHRSQILEALNPRIQELIILPTEQCNFRCTYCYEDFEIGKMSPETIRGLRRLIEARVPHIEALRLSWFGGEPLVAKDIVLEISEFALELCQRHGISLKGGLTTNGYLLKRPLFERLLSLHQRQFQISLDGDRDAHDTTRLRADGKGTFDRIWANLLELRGCDQDFEVLLRLHVTDSNYESLASLCHEIHEHFGDDSRFTPHFHDVRNLGGDGGKTVKLFDPEVYDRQIAELGRILAFGGRGESGGGKMRITAAPMLGSESSNFVLYEPGGGGEADGGPDRPYICYASKPNSLLIRADGRVGKCTVALNDSRNDIGTLQEDGTVALDHDKLGPWVRGVKTLDLDELGCPLAGMPPRGLPVL